MTFWVLSSVVLTAWLAYGLHAVHEHGRAKGRREVYAEWQRAYEEMEGP